MFLSLCWAMQIIMLSCPISSIMLYQYGKIDFKWCHCLNELHVQYCMYNAYVLHFFLSADLPYPPVTLFSRSTLKLKNSNWSQRCDTSKEIHICYLVKLPAPTQMLTLCFILVYDNFCEPCTRAKQIRFLFFSLLADS